MSNVEDVRVKKVPVTLDKNRHLLYDLNAFAAIEEEYGSIEEAMNKLGKGSVKAVRLLLWAGLLHEEDEETFTPKSAGKLVDFESLQMISEAIGKAMGAAMPKKVEGEEVKNSKSQSRRK